MALLDIIWKRLQEMEAKKSEELRRIHDLKQQLEQSVAVLNAVHGAIEVLGLLRKDIINDTPDRTSIETPTNVISPVR